MKKKSESLGSGKQCDDFLDINGINNIIISEEQVDEFYEFCIATGIIEETIIILTKQQAVKEIEKLLIV